MKRVFNSLIRPKVLWPIGVLSSILLAMFVLLVAQPRFMTRQMARQNPDVLFYVETETKSIALTIDDAPSTLLTSSILKILDENSIKSTFFVIGDKVSGKGELIKRMKDSGHELGNHLAHDEASIQLSEAEFEKNLLDVEKLIGPQPGSKWFRPGSGWFTTGMLENAQKLGYRCCLGSIYPFDNKIRNPELIFQIIKANIQPGDILILHEGNAERLYILPVLEKLIPALKAEGYQFLTVSELDQLNKPTP